MGSTLFGGPSQPEPDDERGGIRAAERQAKEDASKVNPNQYDNDDVGFPQKDKIKVITAADPEICNQNWKSHVRWTGPQILAQLPEINVLCAGMGTSGRYLEHPQSSSGLYI